MQAFRAIAPSPSLGNEERGPALVKRHKASTACVACKKRKSRCQLLSGQSACELCTKEGIECVFDVADDMRRRVGQKRKIQELEDDRSLLLQLLKTMGESSESHAMSLFNLIRNKASLGEIKNFLDQGARAHPASQNGEFQDLIPGPVDPDQVIDFMLPDGYENIEANNDFLTRLLSILRESDNSTGFQIANLIHSNASMQEVNPFIDKLIESPLDMTSNGESVEQYSRIRQFKSRARQRILNASQPQLSPLWRVPASPWTIVTGDDEYVSHLISLWYTWCHPHWNWLDRDLFIQDMRSKDMKNSKYCSPFLVNAILADASAYNAPKCLQPSFSDATCHTHSFYQEAKRLYEEEEGRISLPTLQGLGVLWMCAHLTDQDSSGWVYRSQLCYALHELPRRVQRGEFSYKPWVVSCALWGLFNLLVCNCLFESKHPIIKPPPKSQLITPPPSVSRGADVWCPYPCPAEGITGPPLGTVLTSIQSAVSKLDCIAYDLCRVFWDAQSEYTDHSSDRLSAAAAQLRIRISAWTGQLEESLQEGKSDTPHVLGLHMYHSALLISITHLTATATTATTTIDTSTNSGLTSARKIASLLQIHRASWGIDHAPALYIRYIEIAQRELLPHLDDDPADCEAFVSLCIFGKALSRRWGLGRELLLRGVKERAGRLGIGLPVETEGVFWEC